MSVFLCPEHAQGSADQAARGARATGSAAIRHAYCTVTVTVVVLVMAPAVAVTTTL
jgi:hypothetical protein